MAKKKLFKSKTNFSLRRLHQSGNYGNIYERDYTTISSTLSNPGGQIPIYNSPSFKLTIGAGLNKKKKYFYGNWFNNPNSSTEGWTMENMPVLQKKNNDIVLKPGSKKLTDYACYGSASELIRVSLINIVSNFPAEIFVTDSLISESGVFELTEDIGPVSTASTMYSYYNYAIVDNPFYIDVIQNSIPDGSLVSKLRYMCSSVNEYNIISSDGTIVSNGEDFKKWNEENYEYKQMREVILPTNASAYNSDCLTNGDLLATVKFNKLNEDGSTENVIDILCFYMEGEILYLADPSKIGYRIRPNDICVETFYKNLGDFERLLLNRETNYTATFESYNEDEENGWRMSEKKYTWPMSNGGWNIDINSTMYTNYISKLSDLSIGYDTLFTNSIQRDMVHESINNLDLTNAIIMETDEVDNASSKMVQVLNVIGRQFDEIKKYIDSIKTTNSITYSQEQNMPDYFLTDSLNLSGWEVKEIFNGVSDEIVTAPMYGSRSVGYNVHDANSEFMRRLKLNSKQILSKKGTKQGIEDLMAIFGYHSTDWLRRYYGRLMPKHLRKAYILTEHTYVANGYANDKTSDEVLDNVRRINQLKDSYSLENINTVNADAYMDDFQKIPVAEISSTIPGDATNDNTLVTDSVPNTKNESYKYIKILNDYYEWIGYRELNNAPSDYSNSTIINGIVIPKEKVDSSAKYIMMRLHYYQWSGYYKKLTDKPSDAINVSNYKVVTDSNALNTKDNSVQYLVYNSKYYEWDSSSGDNGSYVELSKTPDNLKTKNTKAYNVVPSNQDEDVKYIICQGTYYEWVGKYISTGNPPNDSNSSNTAYVNAIPTEKHSKKYVALNTYFIWEGKYQLYNKQVLVPWFDKNLEYDGDFYFQMKGAWGRNDGKTDDTGATETSVYAYSISKIRYASTIEELYSIPYRNIDVHGIYYIGNDDIYRKVKDIDKHNTADGWETPSYEEIEQAVNIVDINKGNNPHTGEYDNGYSYLEMYGELFKHSTFNNVRKSEVSDRLNYGFNIARYAESTKCMYFGSSEMRDNMQPLRNPSSRQRIVPYNFLGGQIFEEAASFSIINSKEFHITFDDAHRDFIEKDVIPYISQIVPSTTIFSYSFEHLTGDETVFQARSGGIICDGGICPIFGIS